MSWPNLSGQLNSGGKYVYQAEKSFSEKYLRLLETEEGLRGNGLSQAFFQFKECSQYELLLHSLSLHWAFFKEQSFDGMPLWLKLLRSNQSARIFSVEFRASVDEFFSKFALSTSSELTNEVSDYQELYNLAQYERIIENQEAPTRLKLRLDILKGKLSQSDLEEKISKWNPDYLEEKLMWGFYFARKAQRKSEIDLNETKSLLALDYSKIRSEDLHKTIQILNSLNLIHFFRNDFDECEKIFREEEKLIPNISNELIKEHLLGNLYFHKSMVSKSIGDGEGELQNLHNALKHDFGFHDYYYRIASLYHDQGNKLAKEYYEGALKVSPWHQDLINDYGILLNDMNLGQEFEDLKKMAMFLFPEELDDE